MLQCLPLLLITLIACHSGSGDDPDGGAAVDSGAAIDAADPGPLGFIGSPCETVSACEYDAAVCLSDGDGFPAGSCSLACDQFCPDRDGHPTTFCVAAADLPAAGAALGDGACMSRCDFSIFPFSGCRDDYGCVRVHRANEAATEQFVCMPDVDTELSECHFELAAAGVAFEPTVVADASPSTHPSLTCHIEEPVYILSPVHGVDLTNSGGTITPRVLGSCEMAHALSATVKDVAAFGVTEFQHMGTYNCRVIAGTDTLSRHSFADAIDIYGFRFDDGRHYTLIDDWEHGTDDPQGEGAAFLYDAAHRWYDAWIWTIILTPNYNEVHDNHFHVDLTPDSHVLGFTDGRYIGPAPYPD
jgi:hypothetical protein